MRSARTALNPVIAFTRGVPAESTNCGSKLKPHAKTRRREGGEKASKATQPESAAKCDCNSFNLILCDFAPLREALFASPVPEFTVTTVCALTRGERLNKFPPPAYNGAIPIRAFIEAPVMLRKRWLPIFVALTMTGCWDSPARPGASSPEKKKDEGVLAFTDLTKKAYEKLEIKVEKMVLKEVRARRALTGWVMAKPGKEVTLTAPTAGYVRFLTGHALIAGDPVAPKDELLQLDPVLNPVEKIQVAALKRSTEAEFVKAQTTLKNAETEYQRAVELKAIRSKQEFEQAKKALDFAEEELKAAKDKLTYFQTQSITLKAPQAGVILQLHVGPGQYVSTSAPLVTIIDLRPVWVRVPVPEFDFEAADSESHVDVTFKNANHGRADNPLSFKGRLVARVPQIDPIKHTGDMWYELEESKASKRFMKDQMVTVQVPIGPKEKAPVVPTSAVIYDTHGHAWIYLEVTKDGDVRHRFERRPVEVVAGIENRLLMLRTTMADGERVVTNGAAVLFSRDFHKTPVRFDGEDE